MNAEFVSHKWAIAFGLLIFFSALWIGSRFTARNHAAEKAEVTVDPRAAEATAIRRTLAADISLRSQCDREWNEAYKKGTPMFSFRDPGLPAVIAYHCRLQALDLTGCPSDFQEAFLAWCQANRDDDSLVGDYDGLAGTLGGMSELAVTGTNPAEHFQKATALVNERWLKIETIALQYGVRADPHNGHF